MGIDGYASWVASPNHFVGRGGLNPSYIFLHGTANGSRAQDIAAFFAKTASAVSANYVIGQDGTIICCVDETNAPWANGPITAGHDPWWHPDTNPNLLTIAIEHCKPSTDNSDYLTSVQQQASFGLIRRICQRWKIPMRYGDETGGILPHSSVDPVNRSRCPGVYPWTELFEYLNTLQMDDPGIDKYFFVATNGWGCKQTGKVIGGEILQFYRTFGPGCSQGLSWLGLPVTNQLPVNGTGAFRQWFERACLVFDPKRELDKPPGVPFGENVYLSHVAVS